MNPKKHFIKCVTLAFVTVPLVSALVLAACGDESTSVSDKDSSAAAAREVESKGDLPNCNSKREGERYYVADEDVDYLCENNKWKNLNVDDGDDASKDNEKDDDKKSSSSTKKSSSSKNDDSGIGGESSSSVKGDSKDDKDSGKSSAGQSSSSDAASSSSVLSSSSSSVADSSSSVEEESSSSSVVESSSSEVAETLVSCDMVLKLNEMHTCGEMPANIPQAVEFKASCSVSAEEALFVTSTLGTGCPSGYVLKCSDAGGSLYSYNQEDKGKTCEQFLAEQEEDDDEVSSSSSEAKSSSSGIVELDNATILEQCSNGETALYNNVSMTCQNEKWYVTGVEFGTLIDARDGQIYKTVTIGTQTWMAENLNYDYNKGTAKSYCYNDKADSCGKYSHLYGRLYTWAAAMDSAAQFSTAGKGCGYGKTCSPSGTVRGVCPEDWHLPNDTEWTTLWTAVGGERIAGTKLKSTSGWTNSGNGTDSYGFAVLPAGYRDSNGNYYNAGSDANFWSSLECPIYRNDDAILWSFGNSSERALSASNYKSLGYSVRCLRD
ncbi:MAG: fibrobacter succinogenes major paralogous domain-containing protein [Fibrobacter sp.]|nr:fibrobacter succinogenes major paralogous domain-containing protein [Fibrobacter sp.]